jgi:GT2 family glycosyltransferase
VKSQPTASIVIPTRDRTEYLGAALASVIPQARDQRAEVIVVDDGTDPETRALAGRFGARVIRPRGSGLNAARNSGIEAAEGDPIVLIDDDIYVPRGWLQAILEGIERNPDSDVFGGPIRARLQGGGPRACGREPAPITTLDYGPEDRDVERVWGANMALRRRAVAIAGRFDESLSGRGDEEEWQERLAGAGGRVRYLAGAGLDHCRTRADATVRRLALSQYRLGRTARRNDVRKRTAPPLRAECRTLAGCIWHIFRRRCLYGVALAAHAVGRLREALAERRALATSSGDTQPDSYDDFLSGTSGSVTGVRATSRAIVADAVCDAVALAQLAPWRLARAARRLPTRSILALAVEREDTPNLLAAARAELLRSRHRVTFASTTVGERGKFENLNALLAEHPARGHDWLLVVDDDVELPHGFVDEFVFLAERFGLMLAQPAHRHRSHAAFAVTRRRAGSMVRQTAFVEIGPVTAFHAKVFNELLPFPSLRVGWGLDAHWSAVAASHGWPIGVIDTTPVRHGLRRIGASYDFQAAVAEGREFLAGRPYVKAADAQRTIATHRGWR